MSDSAADSGAVEGGSEETPAPSPEPVASSPDPVGEAGSVDEVVAGSFGDAAAEMANETEVEAAASDLIEAGPANGGPVAASPADPDGAHAGPVDDELITTQMALAERTADLQRLQAEYLNFKRRVDRDRDLIRVNATYAALAPITEVLDTIDRARAHAPLEDGFKAVAEQLERVVAAQGLTKFGAVGDAFDPTLHEALSHIGADAEVAVTTCKVIAKAGYRVGDRVLRAAQVLVVDPVESVVEASAGTDAPSDASSGAPSDTQTDADEVD
ncbi:MAG: nucleotide exchange factor GrpE [Nocardioides sp.]